MEVDGLRKQRDGESRERSGRVGTDRRAQEMGYLYRTFAGSRREGCRAIRRLRIVAISVVR